MLIHKFCKKLLIFFLLLLLFLSRSPIILPALLINSPSLIHSCSFNGTLGGSSGGRPGGRLGGRLSGRFVGFSYLDSSTSRSCEEESFWLISRTERRTFCMASFLAYTACICSLGRPRSIGTLSFLRYTASAGFYIACLTV